MHRLTEEEVSSVVEQLEQDRIVASKRAKRLQEDLKKTQQVPPPALPRTTYSSHLASYPGSYYEPGYEGK